MKNSLIILSLFLSFSASADPACTALSSAVGTYERTAGCDDNFGQSIKDLVVEKVENSYQIVTGGIIIGPSTSTNAVDKCTVDGDTITVQTCYKSHTCLPQHWYYTFTKDSAKFEANNCIYHFKKKN